MTATITVLTPTYNCTAFVGKTVRSVLAQRYEPLQYIVLDDGSTDDTQEVLSHYFCYKSLSFVRHPNMGEHHTINKGLRMVEGKYFMIVNADDPLLPNAIPTLVEFMEDHPNVLCAYPDIATLNEDGSYRQERIPRPEYNFRYMVRHHYCLPSVGAIFRSSVIQSVGLRDPSFRWTSDFDYWLRIGLVGDMCRVPQTLACWRHRAGQESASGSKARAAERERLISKFYSLDVPPDILSVKAEAYSWAYLVAAQISRDWTDRANYLRAAIVAHPRQLAGLEFWDALRKYATWRLRR